MKKNKTRLNVVIDWKVATSSSISSSMSRLRQREVIHTYKLNPSLKSIIVVIVIVVAIAVVVVAVVVVAVVVVAFVVGVQIIIAAAHPREAT